jgi:hypothetical protein
VTIVESPPETVDGISRQTRRTPSSTLITRRVALHGVTAEVLAPRALSHTLSIVLGAYPQAAPDAEPDIRVTVERGEGEPPTWVISDGNRTFPESPRRGLAAIRVEWLIVSEALKLWAHAIHVHAGLVATADQSVLLIGRSGSGKSTTTMALALEGLDLYTDDVALIDRSTLRPLSVPRPIKLDRRSRAMLRERGLVIPPGRRLNESIDRTLLPGLPRIESLGPRLTTAYFFADKRADQASLRPLSSAEAVMRLIQQSASERFEDGVPADGAVALVNAIRCYELVAGDLDATVRTILCSLGRESKLHAANGGQALISATMSPP